MRLKLILPLAAAIICGCGSNNDAKIDALSRRVDQVISNQVMIMAAVTDRPDTKAMNAMSYFYYTNLLQAPINWQSNITNALMLDYMAEEQRAIIITNVLMVELSKTRRDLDVMQTFSESNSFMNSLSFRDMGVNIFYIKESVDEIKSEIGAMKLQRMLK